MKRMSLLPSFVQPVSLSNYDSAAYDRWSAYASQYLAGVPVIAASWHNEEHERLCSAIREYTKLGDDWDGFGAARVSIEAADTAAELVRRTLRAAASLGAPEITPKANGTLSLEWEDGDREATVEIGRSRVAAFVTSRSSPTVYLDTDADTSVSALPGLLAALLGVAEPSARTVTAIESDLVA